MRIGIGIGEISGNPATIDDLVAQAQAAERDGFTSGWFANIFGMRPFLAALTTFLNAPGKIVSP